MISIQKIALKDTAKYSQTLLDYIHQPEKLSPFIQKHPSDPWAEKQIEKYSISKEKREVLSAVLTEQYENLPVLQPVSDHIKMLKEENSFTVTTGHQLNLMTGPLYVVFKAVTTILLARKYKKEFPQYNFIPVFWLASEDHDFEEINHFQYFNDKISWDIEAKGPVGRLSTETLKAVLEPLKDDLGLLVDDYLSSSTLSEATRKVLHRLFGDYGLVVLDPDHASLKQQSLPLFEKELKMQKSSEKVKETTHSLTASGYKDQVHSRDINLFYIEDGLRERIIEEEGKFRVNNTEKVFSLEELLSGPASLSPNVVLRPMYQQIILPNISYIGGPGELAYWLQLKDAFEEYEVNYPEVIVRNMGMLINKTSAKRINKTGLSVNDFFKPLHDIKKDLALQHAGVELDLSEEKSKIDAVMTQIKGIAEEVDPSLKGFVGSEEAKMLKSLSNIEKRLIKAQEQRESTTMKQIEKVYEQLFPNGGLQERHDNFFNFFINESAWKEVLINGFDPLDSSFYIFIDE